MGGSPRQPRSRDPAPAGDVERDGGFYSVFLYDGTRAIALPTSVSCGGIRHGSLVSFIEFAGSRTRKLDVESEASRRQATARGTICALSQAFRARPEKGD